MKNIKVLPCIAMFLLVLVACYPTAPEHTLSRPVMPEVDDLIVTVAPIVPYSPEVVPDAGSWPTRPLTIVVPFLPGGDTNMYARMFAPHLADILGQPVYVVNVDGASGTVGAEWVSTSAPDGYTILFYHTGNLFTNVLVGETDLNFYDFEIACIAMHCNANILVVNSIVGINDAYEFLAYIRENPGGLNVATTITGFSFKLLRLAEIAGDFQTNPVHVGGGSMMPPSILAGHTEMGYNNIALFLPYIESGDMIPLWIGASERNVLLPYVPTMAEVGIEGGYIGRSYFFAFPPSTDEAILQKLSDTVAQITANPDFQAEIFETVGLPSYFVPFESAFEYMQDMWLSLDGVI